MRIKRILGTAAAVGAAALFAGSAFTASNTMPTDGGTAGYGSVTASGVTLTSVKYVTSTSDGSKIDQIKFLTEDTNADTMTGTLSVEDSGGTLVVSAEDCGNPVGDSSTPTVYTFTCDPTTDPDATNVVTVGFTATRDAA